MIIIIICSAVLYENSLIRITILRQKNLYEK